MKTSLVGVALLAVAFAATGGEATETAWSVSSRSAHSRVWQKIVFEPSPSGELHPRIHEYVELATGLHFQNVKGEWLESKEEFEILPGKAVAKQGQHKVSLNYNLNNAGAVEMETPDGKKLKSHVLGLSYFDSATGESVLIAEVKDCEGKVSGNQVIYEDAFTDFLADVRYTYTKAGFEQDIILRESPPKPEAYGLNPETTRLQVLTEFLNPPQPAKKAASVIASGGSSLTDESLSFGAMKIGRGKAFALDSEAASGIRRPGKNSIPVGKQWLKLDGRDVLVEEAMVSSLQSEMDKLPKAASAQARPATGSARHTVSAKRLLPAIKVAKATQKTMELARAGDAGRGLVLDYVAINSDTNGFTFQGDTTYFVSGWVSLDGTTTFEGGTVVKFPEDGNGTLFCNSDVVWETEAYRPVVFTSEHDNSVGEAMPWSTGFPAMGLGSYLYLCGYNYYSVKHLNVRYTFQAIVVDANTSGVEVSDSQFINCQWTIPINIHELTLRNVLFAHCDALAAPDGGPLTIHGENITVDRSDQLILDWEDVYQLHLTNSLLTDVTNLGNATLQNCVQTNGAGIYQSAGCGDHYLATNSPCRNAGTSNINPDLLAALQTMTTYAPQDGGWLDNDTPDLGYHYPADANGNSLPDSWEWKYFGNLNQTAAGDYDGDGLSNYREWLQGRNPVAGAVADTTGVSGFDVYTPLK